jgi:hypothetical protein
VTEPRPPKAEQKAKLLALALDIAPKPMLVGWGAVHLGWWASLPDTEELLEEMVREGVLRRATKAELREHGLRHGYCPV